MKERDLIVMKFGGSSVVNAERINNAANIIEFYYKNSDIVVVVSALQGVTNRLLKVQTMDGVEKIAQEHLACAREMNLHPKTYDYLSHIFRDYLDEIEPVLPIYSSDPNQNQKRDLIGALGERFSHNLLAETLFRDGFDAIAIDASKIVMTSPDFGRANILLNETEARANATLQPLIGQRSIPIVTGYFGATSSGEIATLARGGSDYSAAALANVLNAKELILWKEVDGIFSEDPNLNRCATFLPWLPYELAHEMAQDEATKILHPGTIQTLRDKGIVVRVKNTFRPGRPGSVICSEQLWQNKYQCVYNSYRYWEIT